MNHSNGLLDILAAAAASAPELENGLIGQDRARGNFRHVQSNIQANSNSDSKMDVRVRGNWGDLNAVSNTESTPNEVIKRMNDDGKFRQLHPHLYSKHSDSQRKRKKSSPISNSSAKIPKHIHVNTVEQHDQKYIRFSSGLTNSDSESSLAGKKYSNDKIVKEQHNQQQIPERDYQENNCNYGKCMIPDWIVKLCFIISSV